MKFTLLGSSSLTWPAKQTIWSMSAVAIQKVRTFTYNRIHSHNLSFNITELNEFRKISEYFIGITESFAKQVDIEKMRAIGAQNLLKTTSKQRETEQQDLQVIKLS